MQKKKKGCLLGLSIFVLMTVILGSWAWKEMNTWGYRSALPSSASEVNEWFWEDGFMPDYSYQLKAKISEEEFTEYTQEFDMTLHSEDRVYSDDTIWLNWKASPRFSEKWWGPTKELKGTYVSQTSNNWSYAKYEDGYIFVKGLNH